MSDNLKAAFKALKWTSYVCVIVAATILVQAAIMKVFGPSLWVLAGEMPLFAFATFFLIARNQESQP